MMNTYTYFSAEGNPCGTKKSRIVATANGMHILISHGLAFPIFDLVLSTILPTIRSDTPSNSFDTAMIVEITAASSMATFVKYTVRKVPIIPLTMFQPKAPEA